MLPTYKAILQGDRLTWLDEAPQALSEAKPITVYVTVIEESQAIESRSEERGLKMAEILNRLAERSALPEITDPVEWQRDMRRDRPLPDRD